MDCQSSWSLYSSTDSRHSVFAFFNPLFPSLEISGLRWLPSDGWKHSIDKATYKHEISSFCSFEKINSALLQELSTLRRHHHRLGPSPSIKPDLVPCRNLEPGQLMYCFSYGSMAWLFIFCLLIQSTLGMKCERAGPAQEWRATYLITETLSLPSILVS